MLRSPRSSSLQSCADLLEQFVLGGTVLLTVLVIVDPSLPAAVRNPLATNRYVATSGNDANDGSAAHPWRTIAYAARRALPGWTVHVAPGTYVGDIRVTSSGTAGARIRYISDVRWGARIIGERAQFVWQNGSGATEHGGDYVDIMGFDISGPNARIGVISYGSNSRIVGNRVHDIPGKDCTVHGGAGIDIASNGVPGGQTGNLVEGNWVHDVGGWPSPCANNAQHMHGIYISTRHNTVSNNIVFRSASWGIHLYHDTSDETIANNTVFSNLKGGILVSSDGTVMNENTVVSNNIVVRNGGEKGIAGIYEYGRFLGAHNLYPNNLLAGNEPRNLLLRTGLASGTLQAGDERSIFMNYTGDTMGDYHLGPQSVAASAGSPVGAPDLDFDGGKRDKAKISIGVYQWRASPGRWPWY